MIDPSPLKNVKLKILSICIMGFTMIARGGKYDQIPMYNLIHKKRSFSNCIFVNQHCVTTVSQMDAY